MFAVSSAKIRRNRKASVSAKVKVAPLDGDESSSDVIVEEDSLSFPAEMCRVIVYSRIFQAYIFFCIITAGVTVGLDTYPNLSNSPGLTAVDNVILISFVVEVVLKILSNGSQPQLYFIGKEWNWNLFDVLIVVFSAPILPVGATQVKFLRMIRLMRLMKLFHKIKRLRVILLGFFAGLQAVGYIFLLMMLIFYVYALGGVLLFRENDPWHFRSLEITMLNLLRIATFDAWGQILYINYYGCDVFPDIYYTQDQSLASDHLGGLVYCDSPVPSPMMASSYCISFAVLISFCIFSLFIGAVSLGMTDAMSAADEQNHLAKIQDELDALHAEAALQLQRIEDEEEEEKEPNRQGRFDYSTLLPLMTERLTRITLLPTRISRNTIDESAEGEGALTSGLEESSRHDANGGTGSDDTDHNDNDDIDDVDTAVHEELVNNNEVNACIAVDAVVSLDSPSILKIVSMDSASPKSFKTNVAVTLKPIINDAMNNETEFAVEPGINIPSGVEARIDESLVVKEDGDDVRQAVLVASENDVTKCTVNYIPMEQSITHRIKHSSFFQRLKIQEFLRLLPFTFKRWMDSAPFNVLIALTIILATVVITLQTMPTVMNDPVSNQLTQDLLLFINIVFLLEVLIRVTAEMSWKCPWEYFYSFWNVFDLIVMVSGWLSDTVPGAAVLRLLRLFQMIKLLEKINVLHNLMVSVFASFSSIGYIGILLFLYIYSFALLGVTIFAENNESRFGTLLTAMLHLFMFITFDAWSDSLFVDMYGCAHYIGAIVKEEPCENSRAQFFYAALYYSIFVIIGSLVLLSLFIGIITSSLIHQQETEAKHALKKALEAKVRDRLKAKESLNSRNYQKYAFITPRRRANYPRSKSVLSRENSDLENNGKWTSSIASSVAGFFSSDASPPAGGGRNKQFRKPRRASSFAFGSSFSGGKKMNALSPPAVQEDIDAAVASMVQKFSTKTTITSGQELLMEPHARRHSSLKGSHNNNENGPSTSPSIEPLPRESRPSILKKAASLL